MNPKRGLKYDLSIALLPDSLFELNHCVLISVGNQFCHVLCQVSQIQTSSNQEWIFDGNYEDDDSSQLENYHNLS